MHVAGQKKMEILVDHLVNMMSEASRRDQRAPSQKERISCITRLDYIRKSFAKFTLTKTSSWVFSMEHFGKMDTSAPHYI